MKRAHLLLPDFPDSRMGQELEDYARGARTGEPAYAPDALYQLGAALQADTVGELLEHLHELSAVLDDWRGELEHEPYDAPVSDQHNRDGRSARERLARFGGEHGAMDLARARQS